MTLDLTELKTKNPSRDSDLATALAAATGIIAVTVNESTPVAVAGVIVGGVIVGFAVLGRYGVRRGSVDAAGIIRATEAGTLAPTEEQAREAYAEYVDEIETERDPELLKLGRAAQNEQVGNEIPASLEALEELDDSSVEDVV